MSDQNMIRNDFLLLDIVLFHSLFSNFKKRKILQNSYIIINSLINLFT
jgi:hypothetical protein